ncbi:MAG: PAS domain-containing protein [Candidatus Methanoperedens sp.]|nr:PAS domain-containing protein [Candidatus Methanoperedens sp.]MCZ7369088.1 PAS domain-containing protein [Candidatus Methanoperedens sp.]
MEKSGWGNPMMLYIKRWLAPPVFLDDEIKTLRANLLNSALTNISMLVPILLIGDLLGGKSSLTSFAAEVLAFAFCLVLRSWMHRGRVRLARIGLITMGLVLITAVVASIGTIRAPTTAMYLLVVITGGLLFDIRGMMITTALCSLLVGGLIGAENAGLLPHPNYSVTITQWVAYTVIFAWVGILTFSSIQVMNQALTRGDKEITDRKRAEEALLASQEHLCAIIEAEPECVTVVDADSKLVSINRAGLDMIECEHGEGVIGATLYDLIAPEYRDVWRDFHENICRGNKGKLEFAMISMKGNRLWMENLCRTDPRPDLWNQDAVGRHERYYRAQAG